MENAIITEIDKVGKIIVPLKIQKILKQLDLLVGNTEWSGVLFYKLTKGDIKTLKDLEFTVEFIYPMDIGSSTYTEHKWEGSLMEAYDISEEAIECSFGHLHSHHVMGTTFSQTDMQELKDNSHNFNFYVSLIVNFANKYSCKIAFPSKTEITKKFSLKDSLGKLFNKQLKTEEKSIVIGDLEVEIEEVAEENNWLSDRITALKADPKRTVGKLGYEAYDYPDSYYDDDRVFNKAHNSAFNTTIKFPEKTAQFLAALINLDPSKRYSDIFESLKKCMIDVKDPDEYADSLELNLESIYHHIYTEDTMQNNLENVCLDAIKTLNKYSKFAKEEFFINLKETLKFYA